LNTLPPAIVLIENDEVTLELYQRELRKSFTVFAFTELEGVLEVIAKQDIQVVVIEPEGHSGKGWDLIHSIHLTNPDRAISVIVCSTRDSNDKDQTHEVNKYLTKPVLPRTLREETLGIIRDLERPRRIS
jgi:DNA-binding response OmpR family regulator